MIKNRKVIVCTHGRFGEELLKSAEMIVGPLQGYKSYSLLPSEDPHSLISQLERDLKEEDEILCLVDVFGGSPSTLTAMISNKYNMRILSGVNLPMILELSNIGMEEPMDEVVTRLIDTVSHSCIDVLALFKKGREN